MTLTEAKALINCDQLNAPQPQAWFDLGCGSGLFSEALGGLLPEGSLIYAVDKEPAIFKSEQIKFIQLDFVTDQIPNHRVDGILMANSLHFVKDKQQFLTKIKPHLLANGVFLLVEYDTEISNRWIPYPISFLSAKELFKQMGFQSAEKLKERPSLFNPKSIYSAIFHE